MKDYRLNNVIYTNSGFSELAHIDKITIADFCQLFTNKSFSEICEMLEELENKGIITIE